MYVHVFDPTEIIYKWHNYIIRFEMSGLSLQSQIVDTAIPERHSALAQRVTTRRLGVKVTVTVVTLN